MTQKITLIVDGRPRDVQADYLNPGALEYWRAWLAHEARMNHNPLEEFAAKVAALPVELRGKATRQFVAGLNFDVVPRLVLLETLRSLPAVKILCILVTGEDLITKENAAAAFPLLFPFIQRQEFVADSIEEANRLRAKVGKPPIGGASAGVSTGQSKAGQPPQGG